MATLDTFRDLIQAIIRNDSITDLISYINNTVSMVAGGIRLPDGQLSPPLPLLFKSGTVATTVNAYADLPTDYQRNVFYIADDNGDRILPPAGGTYYDFILFLNNIQKKDLSETGSVYRVCARGKELYYQGIPTSSKNLTVMYYRKPVAMADSEDTLDGIPEHLQIDLIKHRVCADILGDILEDSAKRRSKYHMDRFYQAMVELVDFIGIDSEPSYYQGTASNYVDGGICD